MNKGADMATKKMAFAGAWYPETAEECRAAIEGFLALKGAGPSLKYAGGIVPHAGWYFSGRIACRVIAALGFSGPVDTIVLFGAHMHPESPSFILSGGSLETPFGEISVDEVLTRTISSAAGLEKVPPERFPDENTLELQLPFIKYFFPKSAIVVCGVAPSSLSGSIGRETVKQAAELSRTIRIIGSTDMTHYGQDFGFEPAGSAPQALKWVKEVNDRNAIMAMSEMDPGNIVSQGLMHKNMCCPGAVAATASACKEMGAVNAVELDYATSYEKSASDHFVGYSGLLYAFS